MEVIKIDDSILGKNENINLSVELLRNPNTKTNQFHSFFRSKPIKINGEDCYLRLEYLLKTNPDELLNSKQIIDPKLIGKYKITILPNLDFFQSFSINGEIFAMVYEDNVNNCWLCETYSPVDMSCIGNKYIINNKEYVVDQDFIDTYLAKLDIDYISDLEFVKHME